MRIIKLAQIIPRDRVPRSNTRYSYVRRAVDPTSASGGKEYIYVVYQYGNEWGIIGWHGSVNASSLRAQWKGNFTSFESARSMVSALLHERVHDSSKNYSVADSDQGYYNRRIPGTYVDFPPSSAPSTSPSPASQRRRRPPDSQNFIPSITLPPSRIPNEETDHILARDVSDGTKVFLIMVYAYEDGWYSTIEWYWSGSTHDRAFQVPHPKILTRDREQAILMAQRLVDEKLRLGWRERPMVSQSQKPRSSTPKSISKPAVDPAKEERKKEMEESLKKEKERLELEQWKQESEVADLLE